MNTEGITELENHHFENFSEIMNLSSSHQGMKTLPKEQLLGTCYDPGRRPTPPEPHAGWQSWTPCLATGHHQTSLHHL